MNLNQQYMYMLRFNIVHCKMCIFVVLCVDETYYFIFFMCEYSDAINYPNPTHPPSPPPPMVGRGYRLSHFWLAKKVYKEVKKEVAATVLKKP